MANSNLNIKLNPTVDVEAFKNLFKSLGGVSLEVDDDKLEAALDNALQAYNELENKLAEPIDINVDNGASAKIKQLVGLLDEIDINIDSSRVEAELSDLANGALGDLGKAMDDAFDVDSSGASKDIRALAQEFAKAEKETQQLVSEQKLALAQMRLTGQTGSDAFKELEKEIADGEEKLKDFAKAAGKAGDGLEDAGKKATFTDKMAKFGLVADGIRSVGDSVSELSQPFIDLDTASNRIKTLGGDAKALTPTFREMSLEMSKKYPIGAAALQTATYDALSAGIKATKEDITSFMDASTQLAVGGGEEVGNTVNLLSSMINAYGESATKTKNYSDILFTTVNLGKTSVAELSGSLSNVIPQAAAYGFALDKVGGSLALMTANGIPTAQATTKLNALLIEMQNPGDKLKNILDKVGVSVEQLGKKVKSGDVVGAFKDMSSAFKKSGVDALGAFGSTEASAAFNVLTKDYGKLEETFKAFDKSTGATEAAYQDMAGSIENRSKLLKSQVETAFIEMADSSGALGEIAIVGGQMFSELSPMITAMSGMKVMFGDSAGAALNFANKIITSMIPSLAAQTGATAAAEGAQTGLNASMLANPAGIVIAGIAAIAAGLYLFLTKTESGRQLWEKFKSELGDVWQEVKPAFDALIGAGKEVLGFLQTLGGFLYEFMITPFEMGAKVIGMAIDWFLKFIGVGKGTSGVVDMLKTAFNKAGEAIKAVSGVIGMLTEKFRNVKTIIGNFVSSVPEMFGLLLEYAKYYLNPVNWVDGDEKYEAVLSKKFSNLMGKIANTSKEVAKAGTTAVQNNAKDTVQAVQATAQVQDNARKGNEEKDKKAANEAKKRQDKALAEYKKMLDAMAESYNLSKKRIDQSQRQYEIDAESVRLAQNRTANEYDEIALQKEKIKNIEAQKEAYIKAYSNVATLDAKGELVFSAKIKEADKTKISDEWAGLNQQLQDDQNKRDAIEVKIKANTEKFNEEMANFAKEKLKYEVEMGIKPADDYLSIMQSELNDATKELNNLLANKKELILQMQIAPSSDDAAIMESINQEIMKAEKAVFSAQKNYDSEHKSIYDNKLKIVQEANEKELKALEDRQSKEKSEWDRYYGIMQEDAKSALDSAKNIQLDSLDKRMNDELARVGDSEKAKALIKEKYDNLKMDAEKKHSNQLLVIQSVFSGEQLARDEADALKLLEQKKQAKLAELFIAEESGDDAKVQQLGKEIDGIADEVAKKKDVLNNAMNLLGQGASDALASAMGGNTEGVKDAMRAKLGEIAGYIKKLLSSFVIRLVLESPFFTTIAALAGPAAPLVTAGAILGMDKLIGAIVNPMIGEILSFGTGGIVTSPTLSIVGDGAKQGGDNIEAVLRSKQIQAIIQQALVVQEQKFARYIASSMDTSPQIVGVLKGDEIVLVQTRAKAKESRRKRI